MLSVVDTRPYPALPPRLNLAAHVLGRAAELANKPALVILHPDRDETFSYARLLRLTLGCARHLQSLGLAPGDRVLLRLGNGPAFPIAFLGAIAAGLVPVPTSAALTATEITRLAARVAPGLILAEPGIPLPEGVCPVVPPDLALWEQTPPLPPIATDPNAEAYVIFTSGTSGWPAAVSHAHRSILARTLMHAAWEGLSTTDRLLHAGAMNWTYTLGTGLFDPWTVGATALIPAQGTAAKDLPALLARAEATIFASAPGVFRQMLRVPFPDLPHLRHALSAGEALPPQIRAAWEAATQTQVHEALGMTEISTFVSGSPSRPAAPGTTGFVQPGRHVAIVDDAGEPVPVGTPGELAVSAADPGLMRGYLDGPAQVSVWFRTGDAAVMRTDGAITHLGRKDDMLNAGGFRVSPVEVEAAFLGLPGLHACAATEVEPSAGTRIIALFYEASCAIDEVLLRQRAETTLARWKQPRHYQQLGALPRTTTGKLVRRGLAKFYRKDGP